MYKSILHGRRSDENKTTTNERTNERTSGLCVAEANDNARMIVHYLWFWLGDTFLVVGSSLYFPPLQTIPLPQTKTTDTHNRKKPATMLGVAVTTIVVRDNEDLPLSSLYCRVYFVFSPPFCCTNHNNEDWHKKEAKQSIDNKTTTRIKGGKG
jgi:hypothetical protein